MRIRKRFPPSSLSSVALSDPQLNRSPLVQHHHQPSSTQVYPSGNLGVQRGKTDSQPSDPPHQPQMMAGSEKTRWVCSDAKDLKGEEGKDGRWGEEEKSNDSRKRTILGQDSGTGFLPPSGSHQVFERWIEADKAIPLKKRRGSFVKKLSKEITVTEKAKTKVNMKQQNDDEKEERENKERKRGGVIMEGSRCSRVNGRGWRCCQQTLVGYSLCEHHLGKGRLRNITRIAPQKCKSQPLLLSPPLVEGKQEEKTLLDDSYGGGGEEEEEEEVVVVTKKRMKIGTVKARSISSLLGQTNNSEL